MSWNAARPADSDKIRVSAGLIRNNFQALEGGTVKLTRISLLTQVFFPALANTTRLYGQASGVSGQTEVLAVNSAGTATKLTEGGKVGATGQAAIFGNVTLTDITIGSTTNTQNGFCSAWARVDSSGTLVAGYNVSGVVRNTTGVYAVTFSPVMTSINYAVIVTCRDTAVPNSNRNAMIVSQSTSQVIVRTQRNNDTPGYVNEDCSFFLAVFGGR